MAQRSEKQADDPALPVRQAPGAEGAGPLTVLLVDEDEDLRVYLRRCLEQFDALFDRILEVSSGSEALTVARTTAVDLLICGAHLSQPGSAALFSAIRADPSTESVLILLVADADEETDRLAHSPSAHADAVLVGPFNAAGFGDRLSELLASR